MAILTNYTLHPHNLELDGAYISIQNIVPKKNDLTDVHLTVYASASSKVNGAPNIAIEKFELPTPLIINGDGVTLYEKTYNVLKEICPIFKDKEITNV
jgi:hypothetical protein